MLNHRVDRVTEDINVVYEAQGERDAEAEVKQAWVRRRLLLEDLDSSITYPSPDFARHKSREHDEEPSADLLPENGHGEACLSDGEPCSFRKLFHFDGTEVTVEYACKSVDEAAVEQ